MNPELIKALQAKLPDMSLSEQQRVGELIAEARRLETKERISNDFMAFVRYVYPSFIEGAHHRRIAEVFNRVARGELKRVIINLPPRHTKSIFSSYLLPAWYFGLFPEKKIIQASHTAELAVDFGRDARNLIASDSYQDIFPGIEIQQDSKAAGRWGTNKGGKYFAVGVGGAVAGKGADIFIVDDPHSEQEAIAAETDPKVFDKAYEWYTSGPRQRLQPGGAIVICMTRWGKKDLTGQILDSISRTGEHWEVIEFPAILPNDKPLWPEFWTIDALELLRQTLPHSKWMAQYQQQPTSDKSAIVKREWWKIWEDEKPPQCEFIIQSWDTAVNKTDRSDYSAGTTWGVFYQPNSTGNMQANIIILNAIKKRMEFPELKQRAFDEYREWSPDILMVEAKQSGSPLIFELRAMGVPVQEFNVTRGTRLNPNDKIARLNSVSDLFASGMVWAPKTRWADEVIEEVASFPSGEHDDLVDSTVMTLIRYRRGGFIRMDTDENEDNSYIRRSKGYY